MNKTIGILAHVDCGKTTFCEQLLYHTNVIRKRGRVDNKDTFLDLDVRAMSIQLVKDVIRRNTSTKSIIVPSNNRFINLAIKPISSAIKNSIIKCLDACKEFKYYELWHKDFRGIATKYIYRYYYWYKNNNNIKYIFYAACI